eukprot:5328365-Karenia_brevis.AAC.1
MMWQEAFQAEEHQVWQLFQLMMGKAVMAVEKIWLASLGDVRRKWYESAAEADQMDQILHGLDD